MATSFEEFKKLTFWDEHSRKIDLNHYEVDEQRLVFEHLPRDACVLELGARCGVVSCAIGSVLSNPSLHVAVEPDTSVIGSLVQNRLAHGGRFAILPGAIGSDRRFVSLKPDLLATHVSDTAEGSVLAPTFTWEQAQALVDKPFDTIVADIEGSFGRFVEEHASYIEKQVKFIFFEKDAPHRCNYSKVINELEKMGFIMVIDAFHCILSKP